LLCSAVVDSSNFDLIKLTVFNIRQVAVVFYAMNQVLSYSFFKPETILTLKLDDAMQDATALRDVMLFNRSVFPSL
jgi:hypothetical protein